MATASFKKTNMMRQIERRFPGETISEIIARVLREHGGSIDKAAAELLVSGDTLRGWVSDMGITIRTVVEVATASAP